MTLSPPVRVAAVVAALVLTGLGAFVFLLGGPATSDPATQAAPTTPASTPATQAPTPTKAASHRPAAKPKPALARDLPVPLAKALLHRRVVVVAVWVPGASVDRVVRREARAGAEMSRAGFVSVSASSESALEKLVAKAGVLPAPAVLVVKRPGVVTTTLSVTDRQTVAAAVAQARGS